MSNLKRILVFQHIACEHPGIFRDCMRDNGIEWDAVELDEGESIPALADYDAVISMGGPMDVWQEDQFPWLRTEKEAIHEAVRVRNMPFFGICLGHQLLAEALGGTVGKAEAPEVGMLDVDLTAAGSQHTLTGNLPSSFKTLQWHGAEVQSAPNDAAVLMSSPLCAIQSFAVGTTAFGIQFHVETGPQTIDEWNAVPEYAAALTDTFGPGGAGRLRHEAQQLAGSLTVTAKQLFANWLAACQQPGG